MVNEDPAFAAPAWVALVLMWLGGFVFGAVVGWWTASRKPRKECE